VSNNTIDIRLEPVQYGTYCLWMGLDAQRNLYMTYPANATDAMYRAVFGMTAKQMEESLGCSRHESRDYLDSRSLNRINSAESAIVAQIDNRDVEPLQAIKNVVDFLCLTPSQPVAKLDAAA
jgi:hypothetical protein